MGNRPCSMNMRIVRATSASSVVFFFSSRRRHTRFDCDWSSDVCSSDLDDGCLFAGAERAEEIPRVAHEIWQRERHQAQAIKSGRSLREQLEFARYLKKRATDPSYTFREHLRKISGAIEE